VIAASNAQAHPPRHKPCTVLDIWRWSTYAEAEREDYAGADAVRDDIERQIAAAGWVQVSTGDGYWRWEQG
jgi:hypothetical protein